MPVGLHRQPHSAPRQSSISEDDELVSTSCPSALTWHRVFPKSNYALLPQVSPSMVSKWSYRLPRAVSWSIIGSLFTLGMVLCRASFFGLPFTTIPIPSQCNLHLSIFFRPIFLAAFARPSLLAIQKILSFCSLHADKPTRQPHLTSLNSISYDQFLNHRDGNPKPFGLLPVTSIPVDCLEDYFSGQA